LYVQSLALSDSDISLHCLYPDGFASYVDTFRSERPVVDEQEDLSLPQFDIPDDAGENLGRKAGHVWRDSGVADIEWRKLVRERYVGVKLAFGSFLDGYRDSLEEKPDRYSVDNSEADIVERTIYKEDERKRNQMDEKNQSPLQAGSR